MTVTTADSGAARVITWDRQARRNAWDLATMTAVADAIEAAGGDPAVRCVVLRGAGEHFSAGDDLHAAVASDSAAWAATIEGFQRLTRVVLAAPVPAIAAVDGVCVGGALEFAASCDLRICTNRVRLMCPEVTIGLTASNAGTLLLPEVLGETAARELLLGGEPRDAAWAGEHGFATEIVAPASLDARTGRWAAMFARNSRAAVAATKAMLNERFGGLLDQAMDRETDHCVRLFEESDAREALRGFAERRQASAQNPGLGARSDP
jgi:enoyl-CoA hydratase/carnithine racemase